ncbi:hypothetical protein BHM03_00014974, partial [Ensete ventricosum]
MDCSLPGGTAKISRRQSISVIDDRLREQSTVDDRLRKKKGRRRRRRRRRKEEEEKGEEEIPRPCALSARGSAGDFSPRVERRNVSCVGREIEA